MERLLRHCSALVAGDVAANALSVISLAITARALGAEVLGVLTLIQTYATVVDELVNFQAWKAVIRFGAGHVGAADRRPLQGLVKLGFLIDVASAVVATLLAIAGAFVVAAWQGLERSTTLLLVLNSAGILFNIAGTPTAILRLFERFRLFSVQKTVAAAVKLVGVAIAWRLDAGLAGFVVVWLVTSIVGRILLLVFGLRTLRQQGLSGFLRAPMKDAGQVFRFTVWTNLSSTLQLPIKQFDMAFVGALISVESVGVYRIIKQIALLMTMVSDSVYQVIYPRLAGLLAAHDLRGALREARRTGILLFGFTGTIAVGVALLGPWAIGLFLGADFARDPVSLTTYMVLRSVSCALVVVHPLFLAMGYVKRELLILLVANSLYMGAALVLGQAYGLLGIVLAYGVQFSSVVLPKLAIIRSEARRRPAAPEGDLATTRPPG
jgi:O-antigen/teichoic acid export membrane protein